MKNIYYLCIVIGLFVVFYAQISLRQNAYILVSGIILLMLGLFNISRPLSSKKEDASFIKTEYDEEE